MDAHLFQQVYDALQLRKNFIYLQSSNQCPIGKIVWSSFDYTTGPELRFAWRTEYYNQGSNQNVNSSIDDTTTVDGNLSTDSSLSKNTNESDCTITKDQYEEIDEMFQKDLMLTSDESRMPGISEYDINRSRSGLDESIMSDEIRSCVGTNSTLTFVEQPRPGTMTTSETNSSAATIAHDNATHVDFDNSANNGTATTANRVGTSGNNNSQLEQADHEQTIMSDSCVDSGFAATTSMESDLSSYCDGNGNNNAAEPSTSASASTNELGQVRYRSGTEKCEINLDYANISTGTRKQNAFLNQELGFCEEAIEDDEERSRMREAFNRMSQSQASCNSSSPLYLLGEADQTRRMSTLDEFYAEAEMLTEMTSNGAADCGLNALSDEEFISKFVLAEQIYSTQLQSNPILHKLTIIPSKRIVIGSFLFTLKHRAAEKSSSLAALSVVLPADMSNWYMKRQPVFQDFFSDLISRLKAAYLVENMEDVVCRLTREFTVLLDLFAALERHPLTNSTLSLIKIQSSLLWEKNKPENLEFIAKSVTACLMTKGMCTVIGADSSLVLKMMITLSLFIDKKYRPFCLRPFHYAFNPYLRIQGIKRSEVESVYMCGADCHWPLSLIDVDRKSVTFSGSYARHRLTKRKMQFFQVGQILKDMNAEMSALDERRCAKEPHLELQVVKADPAVTEFLDNFFLLPLERAARLAYIDHFHLMLDNRAQALLRYVEDVSVPSPSDKRSALSASWNVHAVKAALGLNADTAFAIALARADSLKANFAEFVYQTAMRPRR